MMFDVADYITTVDVCAHVRTRKWTSCPRATGAEAAPTFLYWNAAGGTNIQL